MLALPHAYDRLPYGEDLERTFRALIGVSVHPNIAAVFRRRPVNGKRRLRPIGEAGSSETGRKREMTTGDTDTVSALLMRYVDAIGAGDDDLLRNGVWAPDAVWEVTSIGRFAGIDAIMGALAESRKQIAQVLQVITGVNVVIDASAATGRGRCYIQEIMLRTDGSERELRGVYDDRFVRSAAGWRFSHRRFTLVYRRTRAASAEWLPHPGPAPSL